METLNNRIKELTKEIGLPGIRSNFESLARESGQKNTNYQQYLCDLLEKEYASRLKSRKASRIRQAEFPYKKYLEDLQRDELPPEAFQKLQELETLQFIKQGRNIIFAGNPGTGYVKQMIM